MADAVPRKWLAVKITRHDEYAYPRSLLRDTFCKLNPVNAVAHMHIGNQKINFAVTLGDSKSVFAVARRKHEKVFFLE
jgi:hypothetical protein